MNLKYILISTLLLALAAVPAVANDQQMPESEPETEVSASSLLEESPKVHEVTPLAGLLNTPNAIEFIELSVNVEELTCEEIQDTPCVSSCPSCYPTPACPLTPCYCSRGVCQCDVEAIY